MSKEQEAVKRCNKLIETEHSNWIGISNQKAIETVLNMLKEKDAEIEKYKQLYYILSRQNARIEHDNMEKDKMIDLMAECILNLDNEEEICTKVEDSCYDFAGQKGKTCDNCIKQFFEKLAKEKGE